MPAPNTDVGGRNELPNRETREKTILIKHGLLQEYAESFCYKSAGETCQK